MTVISNIAEITKIVLSFKNSSNPLEHNGHKFNAWLEVSKSFLGGGAVMNVAPFLTQS